MALLLVLVVAAVNYKMRTTDRSGDERHTYQHAADAELETAPAPIANEPAVAAAELSDEALCWVWRRSFAQLQRTTDPGELTRLAVQRQSYLDELERRHPARFAAWISSGARAAGDPHPFIRGRRAP